MRERLIIQGVVHARRDGWVIRALAGQQRHAAGVVYRRLPEKTLGVKAARLRTSERKAVPKGNEERQQRNQRRRRALTTAAALASLGSSTVSVGR